jgi:copper transport protein
MFTLEASVAAFNYVSMALLVGSLATCAFLLPSEEAREIQRRLTRFAVALSSVVVAAHFASLLVQGAKLSGGDLPSADLLARYILRTQSGKIWLARGIYALVFLFVLLRFARAIGAVPLFFLSLPLVASRSLSGHAIAVRDGVAFVVGADAIHLIATASWAGVLPFLFYLLVCERRRENETLSLAPTAIARFSRLALCSVTILVATGLFQSWKHVGGVEALRATTYGNVLTVKFAIFVCMALLGGLNFLFTKPGLTRASHSTITRRFQTTIFRRVGAEALLGVLILILSGFLTALPPAAHSGHTLSVTASAVGQGSTQHQHHSQSSTSAPESVAAADGASVEIISPKPGQIYQGDRVPVRVKLVKGKRGHHVHAYVDDELMGMFESESGTLTGLTPGRHVLKIRVVAADHITELDAADEVEFTVKTTRTKDKDPDRRR